MALTSAKHEVITCICQRLHAAKLIGQSDVPVIMAKKKSPHTPAESALLPQSEMSSHLRPTINQYTLPSLFDQRYSLITEL